MASLSAMAANYLIVNESYDPPPSGLGSGDWQYGNVANVSRQYVHQGVGGSMALQVSATLLGPDYCEVNYHLFQSGVMGGNELATRDNTVLSFDLKIDQPGVLNVQMYLDAFTEYLWNYGDIPDGHLTISFATLSLGAYQPGVFQRIVLPLNDPRLVPVSSLWPLFDPSARTYNNITLRVSSGSFAALPASFKITVDNVRITTKNAMVPLQGTGAGAFQAQPDGSYIATEFGVAEQIGSFTQVITIPADHTPPGFELTSFNGDKLLGAFVFGVNDYGVQIKQGTGRFLGAVGSYRAVLGFGQPIGDGTLPYTSTLIGGISTVGSNQ
jgi:hypothetical protein